MARANEGDTMSMLDNAHSWATSVVRGTLGLVARNESQQRAPELPLELYEFESCPYCRKVREALTALNLDYVAHPCARGSRNRSEVKAMGGRELFPYLVDPNTGRRMYESEDIRTYLAETYGAGRSLVSKGLAPLNTLGSSVASLLRPKGGRVREAASTPERLLELWQFENSPYCRKVREELAALDLSYRVHNVGKTSSRRAEMVELAGKVQVPYLVDPNTGTAMFESDDIIDYLRNTYANG